MQIITLRWAVGAFAVLLGAMMLIVPHRFETSVYTALHPNLVAWGIAYLLAGGGMLAASALPPRAWLIAAHLAAGAVFLLAARGFAAHGVWLRVAIYTMIGLGTLAAPLLEGRGRPPAGTRARPDLLVLLIGVTAVVASAVLFTAPAAFITRFYATLRPGLHWYAFAFLLTGLTLLYGQWAAPRSRFAVPALHLAGAATFLSFLQQTAMPAGDWAASVYYGGFAAFIAVFPWADPAIRRIRPSSLRVRVALLLIMAAAAPLIAAATIVTDRADQSATAQALVLQRTIADTLADDVSRYVGFYQATAGGLARAINLAQMPAAQQDRLLEGLSQEYPDVFAFATYDERGHPIARGDSLPRESIAGSPVFEHARPAERTLRADAVSLSFAVSPLTDRLLFEFGAPLRRADASWSGLLVISVESARVTDALERVGAGARGQAYVVDAQGRIVAHQAPFLNGSFRDVSAVPPVAALITRRGVDGVVRYRDAEGDAGQLAGYAPVSGTELGVVVERPLAVALAGARGSREIAFGLLLLIMGGAAGGGIIAAGILVRPLDALARETKRVGEHGAPGSLPESSVAEIRDLTETFAEMSARLAAQTRERDRAHAAIREREARIHSILDSTSDGFLFIGRDGRIKSVNHRAAELIPLARAWPVEGEFARVVAGLPARPAERDALVGVLQAFTATGEAAGEGDLDLGAGRVLHWDAQPARDEAGAAVGLTFTIRDVTQEREVSRMKSDFVAFVTHQLRTPLSGIKWLLELAADTHEPPEMRAYIQDAREANERLVSLVNDLLDISRLESGRLAVSLQALHLGRITESVVEELAPLIKEKGHRLLMGGGRDVPEVIADPQLLRQAVMNLLSNAIKYTPAPGDISLAMQAENGCVRWEVRDSGIGIPKDALPRLFEKFYRAGNVHKIETEGTGLGLYLVRLIVERLGGRIGCESEEGHGATFFFTIPVGGGREEWTPRANGS